MFFIAPDCTGIDECTVSLEMNDLKIFKEPTSYPLPEGQP